MIQYTKVRHNRIIVLLRYEGITILILAAARHLGLLYVIILHPVIDFHGPNIDQNFHVDWFGSFRRRLT